MKKWTIVTLITLIINLSLPLFSVMTTITEAAERTTINDTETTVSPFVTEVNQTEATSATMIEESQRAASAPDTTTSDPTITENAPSESRTSESTQALNEPTETLETITEPSSEASTSTEVKTEVGEDGKTRSYTEGYWGYTTYRYYIETQEIEVFGGSVLYIFANQTPWFKHKDVKKITIRGPIHYDTSYDKNLYLNDLFAGLTQLTAIEGLEYIDMSSVKSMKGMFSTCRKLTELDLSSWDTHSVQDFSYMFNGCERLKSMDLSTFNTSKATDFSYMFFADTAIESLNLANFDISKATAFIGMFERCRKLDTVDCSNWQGVRADNANTIDIFKENDRLDSIQLPAGSQSSFKAEIPLQADVITYNGKWVNGDNITEIYSREELLGQTDRTAGHYYRMKNAYEAKVKYVDENHQPISEEKTIRGSLSANYDVSTPEYQLDIPGYTFEGVPENATGHFTIFTKPIIYRYAAFITPVIETTDSSLYQGQAFDATANFIKGTDHLGQPLTLDNPALTLGGDTVDPNTPGEYHQTLTYEFKNAETVVSEYTVTVLPDQTTAALQDVRLFIGDTFDANAPFKQVVDKDGKAILADKVDHYFIDDIESRTIDTSKTGEHTVRIQLQKANGDILESDKPDAVVRVKNDETAIEAQSIDVYLGEEYNPAAGFISATNADGETLSYTSDMSWTENGKPIDTTVAGSYQVTYGIRDHNGKMVECHTEVTVKDPVADINVTIPTAMLFANTENEGLAKTIASNPYHIINNSPKIAINVAVSAFDAVETNGLTLLGADEPDPQVESNSLRLALKADGTEVISSLTEATTNVSIATLNPTDQLTLTFGGNYFGSAKQGVKTEIKDKMILKFNVMRD
ncbi:BspA family leucine-rich repeat surface protein [Brochothrix campestris]|uniref:Cell wall anchor domain-containing protein n=1 Tax=Brochothrix campestris FSL F6-1037 TaxID=1265861 RepID=W7CRW2_9LIST|nr:BspA family leucine-rich repeat surface protein [Brochothrix campestris]EUJ39360.1 cell wall anchor domain-containing protein [Brochothrix campestris FSL F6-1037]